MARLALHQPDARSGARLTAALGGTHKVIGCPDWSDLLDVLDTGSVEGCLVDADHPSPGEGLRRVTELRRHRPDLALIGFTDRTGPVDYLQLGAAGLEAFVTPADGAIATRNAVDDALALRRGRAVTDALEGLLARPAPEALGWAVARAAAVPTVEDMAAALGVSLHALRRDLVAEGLPTPGTFLLWGRLASVAFRLSWDQRPVEQTAFTLGYASPPSLARATRLHLGVPPSRLALLGPGHVLSAFVSDILDAPVAVRIGPDPSAALSQPARAPGTRRLRR